MSDDKKPENNFKFGLYLRGEKIFERIFSADIYNPVVRYSVDIRDRIPSIIESIQGQPITTHRQSIKRFFQCIKWQSGIQQSPQKHIAADT